MQSLGLSRMCLGSIQGPRRRGRTATAAWRSPAQVLLRPMYIRSRPPTTRQTPIPTRTLSLAARVFAVGVTGLQGSRVQPALGHRAALEQLSLTSPSLLSFPVFQSAHHSTTHYPTSRDAHAHAHDRYDPRCNGCAQPQFCGAHRLPVVHGFGHGDVGRRRL
jgi:hypothetical protein